MHTLNIGLVAALSALWGCSGAETTEADPGPTGPPSLQIVEPAFDGTPVCVSVGDNADTRIPILTRTRELTLRPPGGCPGISQCGHLALYADGVLNNEGAVKAIDLLIYKLGDPYHDGAPHTGTVEPDVLHVQIDVVSDDSAEVLLDHDGEPLSAAIDLITVPDCSAVE